MPFQESEFAEDCIDQGLILRVNPHYLLAVAKLRSGLSEGADGDRIGPYRITKDQWTAFNSLPDLEFSLNLDEIDKWRSQISFAGAMAARAMHRLRLELKRNPSALELYKAQFPEDTNGLPDKLQKAADDTAQLFLDAVDVVVPPDPKPTPINNVETPPPGHEPSPGESASAGEFATLLDFIGKVESRNNYNAYFRHGNNTNNPELVSKTIDEILAFQKNFTDGGSPSSASGKYQIIRKTLKGLVAGGAASGSDAFSPTIQDKLAVVLLKQRGLNDFLSGALGRDDFGVNLAMEWASMPVLKTVTRPSDGRVVNPGQSYYAGDNLNKALVTVDAFRAAITAIKT